MTSSNFNLRGVPSEVMKILKRKAKEQHVSINFLILMLVEEGIGLSQKKKKTIYHDLDDLAGTWTEEEAELFEKNIKAFEVIDDELWQ